LGLKMNIFKPAEAVKMKSESKLLVLSLSVIEALCLL